MEDYTHTGNLQNRIKEQKGSITLFVLISCMFMITVLLLVNIGIMNKNASQNRELAQIAKNYAVNEKDLENTYKKIADENGYPSYKEVQDIVNEMIKGIKEEVKLEAFPVGSIYLSTNSDNPSNYLGGTWESYGQGRTLVGEGTGTDSNNTAKLFNAGATGGEYTHKITLAEIPAHTHTFSATTNAVGNHTHGTGNSTWSAFNVFQSATMSRRLLYGGSGTKKGYQWTTDSTSSYNSIGAVTATGAAGSHSHTVSGNTGVAGSSTAGNNIQPYIVTYMWKRTS